MVVEAWMGGSVDVDGRMSCVVVSDVGISVGRMGGY